jgi:hypothetical protein
MSQYAAAGSQPGTPATSRDKLRQAESRLAALRAEHASLIAACRAGIAAQDAGTAGDPLGMVRAWLDRRGGLPAPGAAPQAVLADSRTAMTVAGATS